MLRFALGLLLLALTGTAHAQMWVDQATISPTTTLSPGHLCYTDGRDIACDATAPLVNAALSTVSTTSMVPGWPDAIRCYVTNPNIGYRVLYIQEAPYTDGKVIYREPSSESSTNDRGVVFNANGTFNSADFYTTHTCSTSISALYAAGQAFNFIGGGTSSSTALGDRITSGTTAVTVNSATNTISLTLNNVTTGYINSAGLLVVPGISITQNYGISSTTGYFSGNVGIATNSPSTTLTVSGTVWSPYYAYQLFTGLAAPVSQSGTGGGGGSLTGSGANTQIAYWNSSTGLTGSSGLTWNGTTLNATTFQVAQSSTACNSSNVGMIRRNSSTNKLQVCLDH